MKLISAIILCAPVLLLLGCSQSKQQESTQQQETAKKQDMAIPTGPTRPDWLPKYPTVAGNEDLDGENAINFLTPDRASKIIGFYESKLKAAGFTIGNGSQEGGYMPIGGGEFRVLNARRRIGTESVEFEMAVQEQTAETSQVVAHWKSRR